MVLELILVALCAWLLHIHLDQRKKRVNLPGPSALPIIGHLLHLEKKFQLMGYRMTEKYGKALYFNIVNEHFVSIGDVKLAKELYSLDETTGRPLFDLFLLYEDISPLGLVNSEGQLWQSHRRFALRHLRDFGFGKKSFETLIMDEVHEFVENLKRKKGSPVDGVKELFSLAVVNSLWTVVSGQRYSQDDPKLRDIANSLNRALTAAAETGGIIFFLPWLRYIIPEYTGYTATRNALEQLKEFVAEAVKEHQKTFQPDTSRDLIDVYLKEIYAQKDPKSTFYGKEAEKQLIAVAADLFFGGTSTTSASLAWSVLYLSSHQDVQRKLYDEIIAVTGNSRDVSVADRPNLAYLQSTIDEVLRMSSILPSGVNHRVRSELTYKGVTYPKGTNIAMNIYYIHHNPETWGDPENFRPERFLSVDGKTYKKNENVVSFSIGRRQCLGEPLARDTIFLFIGNLVQNFHLCFEPSSPQPSLEPAIGIVLNPQAYQVSFKSRIG